MDPTPTMTGRYDDTDLRRMYDGFASSYRWQARLNDALFGVTALRRWALAGASGDVLDVACGTGENFPHLRDADRITAVDLSPAMLAQAADRADRLGLAVDPRPMSAHALAFDDDTFDVVATAMSTCTFPEPERAVAEMARVARPGGRVVLIEHGRSRVGWIARLQDRWASGHYRQAGCRWNQDVSALLDRAPIAVERVRHRTLGVFTAVVARPA